MQIETKQSGWKLLRRITAADTALAAATYDSKPAGAVELQEKAGVKEVQIIFAVDGSNNDANTINIWAGKNKSAGPAELVGTMTVTAGTAVANTDPASQGANSTLDLFVDTITITADMWDSGIFVGKDQANNRIAKCYFDTLEAEWIYVDCTSLNSNSVHVYYAPLAPGV
jgi:hypothetical protein